MCAFIFLCVFDYKMLVWGSDLIYLFIYFPTLLSSVLGYIFFITYRIVCTKCHVKKGFRSSTRHLESSYTWMVRLREPVFWRLRGSLNHFNTWMNETFRVVCSISSPSVQYFNMVMNLFLLFFLILFAINSLSSRLCEIFSVIDEQTALICHLAS